MSTTMTKAEMFEEMAQAHAALDVKGAPRGGSLFLTLAERIRALPCTTGEAGRKGGRTVRDARGHEFFVGIGKKGGARVKAAFAALRATER